MKKITIYFSHFVMLTWGPKTSSTVVHTEISMQKLTVLFSKGIFKDNVPV